MFISIKPIANKQSKARKTKTKIKQQQHYSHNDLSLENIQKVMINGILSFGGLPRESQKEKENIIPVTFPKL